MLSRLQHDLIQIYDLPAGEAISHYLIDQTMLGRWVEHPSKIDEQMIIRSDSSEYLDVGLYVREEILRKLPQDDTTHVTHETFSDFCVAVEGVSHFVLLHFKASHAVPVTALELELQAEIDKFIAAMLYADPNQHPKDWLADIHHRLFDGFQWRSDLSSDERERYALASRLASRFCRLLARRLEEAAKTDWVDFFQFLRRFYRQSWEQKFATVGAAGY